MTVFRRIAVMLGVAVFCFGLAVTAGSAQGRHGGRHDNGRHLGWYKNRGSRVYYGTSYYRTYRPVYYQRYRTVRYYPNYYSSYRWRRAYWRRLRMRRAAYWRYRHHRRYRYMRYRRL